GRHPSMDFLYSINGFFISIKDWYPSIKGFFFQSKVGFHPSMDFLYPSKIGRHPSMDFLYSLSRFFSFPRFSGKKSGKDIFA
ncbi:MAG: hypothetical protein LBJ60_04870, partial [Tannerellaceae bacterium]|nr:hypothetical protein [Tannerellaceae bacterium]